MSEETEKESFDFGIGKKETGLIDKNGNFVGNIVVFDPYTGELKSIDKDGDIVRINLSLTDYKTWIPKKIEKKDVEDDKKCDRLDILDL